MEIAVENGDLYDTDTHPRGIVHVMDQITLGGLIFELDLVADDGNFTGRSVRSGSLGQDLKTYHRTLGTTDLLHHILQTPTDHVLHYAVPSLGNADNMIAAVNQAALVCRSPGDGTLHHRVLVFSAQHRADAFEGEPHADVEVLRGARRHIARMGLQTPGVGVDEDLKDLVAVELSDTSGKPLVAFA